MIQHGFFYLFFYYFFLDTLSHRSHHLSLNEDKIINENIKFVITYQDRGYICYY